MDQQQLYLSRGRKRYRDCDSLGRSGGRWGETHKAILVDCCLCSSTMNSYGPLRNSICTNCFAGARQVLDLAQNLEQDQRDDMEVDTPRVLVPRKRFCSALEQMTRLEAHEEASKFLESVVQAFRDDVPADVELVTNDGLSLKVHRVVIAKNSSVFRTMFEADQMKEPHTGAVHIQELSHDQLKYLLEFLYCGKIPDEKLAQHSHALLIAADKYDIPVLGKVCEAYIGTTVSSSNVLEILELAKLCSAFSLKETAMSLILNSYGAFLFTKEYEKFAMKNAFLAEEIAAIALPLGESVF